MYGAGSWMCYACATTFAERVAWCPTCLGENLVGPSASRPRSAVEQTPQIATARDLAKASWTLVASSRYRSVRFLRGALCLVYGQPGSGKSTLALGLLDGFGVPSVAYLSEEGLGPAVGERLARLAIRGDDMCLLARASLDQFASEIARRRARVALIDSVSAATLTAPDLRHLLAVTGLHALVAVQTVSKAGLPSGSNAVLHEADVAIEVIDGRWSVVKSRYQDTGACGDVQFTAVAQ